MATTKITNPELFDLGSLDSALKLPSGTTAERPTSPSTGEWRYNTDNNLIEYYDGGSWRELQDEEIPPVPSENFNTVLYTGTGATQSITGVGFQPDFVWIKQRNTIRNSRVVDSTRGATKHLITNLTNAQSTTSTNVLSLDSDGFTVGTATSSNENGGTFVAWCWKANGGNTSSNTDGTITSTVQVNSKAKFSVVQYTANAVSGATIGHGLGVEPDLVIVKNLNLSTQSWNTYVKGVTTTNAQFLTLNTDAANGNTANPRFIPGNFSSSVFSVGNDNSTNGVSDVDTYIAYCFASVAGYSKIGSYTGNGVANGPIINTGFEPARVMVKGYSNAGSWWMYDNKRSTTNPRNKVLRADSSAAETTNSNYNVNFLSNGFQFTGTDTDINGSGRTYIYMAFASDPSTAPVLADSFNTTLYTGDGGTQSITGLGFSPSLVWIKQRNTTRGQNWYDVLRGAENLLLSNGTGAASQEPAGTTLGSFDTDGFTVGTGNGVNQSGGDYVSWNWKANSIPTINTDGNITSVVSVNQAAGFSIIKYTSPSSPSSSTDVVGHGLGTTPAMVIVKRTDGTENWLIWHQELGGGGSGALNKFLTFTTASEATASNLFNTVNSTVVNLSYTSAGNLQNIAYAFAEIPGFSKFGGYAGTGSSNPITGLGFSPNYVMIKSISSTENWAIFDTSRGENVLYANASDAESAFSPFTFDSDGFTVPAVSGMTNGSGQNYIYIAFKENPSPQPSAGNMSFLVVAGGGGGGVGVSGSGGIGGGGAGAGGLRTSYGPTSGGGSSAESDITLAAGTYTITIGSGGAATTNGGDSSLAASGLTTITSVGGGRGGNRTTFLGASGGSGGANATDSTGGGTTNAGTSGQGYESGPTRTSVLTRSSSGGGGAGGAGIGAAWDPANENGGTGGLGLSLSITGSSVGYAGGGGGGAGNVSSGVPGGVGSSGGGSGGSTNGGNGSSGTTNTGGGGGGAGAGSSVGSAGTGGSGVVVLRLATSEYSGTTTGSPTVTTDGDYTILTYTGSGTYVHS